MSKTYIVETDDETQLIVEIGVNSTGAALITTHPVRFLTPYAEPDLNAIKQEEYEKGYKTAKVQCNIQAEKDLREVGERHYQKGLSDAWEAARKIFSMDGEVRETLLHNCFFKDVIENISASEAIKKIRQYEQEQKDFKVGDEVISDEDIKGVTVDMDDCLLHVLDENGVIQAWPREDAVKTGRYFPEIAEVLRKMQEEKE